MVVLRQAKPCRSAEPPLLASELAGLGVPEVGRLTGDARADGGDLFWLDDHTLAAGRSHRTNAEAHAQLAALLEPEGVRVLPFHLPWHRGPAEVLHLMSVISPVAPDLAVVYEPIAPTPLLDELAARGIAWIPVSDEEYAALGSNILATGPGRVIMLRRRPRRRARAARRRCRRDRARRLRVRRRHRRPHLRDPPPPPRLSRAGRNTPNPPPSRQKHSPP